MIGEHEPGTGRVLVGPNVVHQRVPSDGLLNDRVPSDGLLKDRVPSDGLLKEWNDGLMWVPPKEEPPKLWKPPPPKLPP